MPSFIQTVIDTFEDNPDVVFDAASMSEAVGFDVGSILSAIVRTGNLKGLELVGRGKYRLNATPEPSVETTPALQILHVFENGKTLLLDDEGDLFSAMLKKIVL